MNVANAITLLRLCLVPALAYFLVQESYALAFWAFVIAAASDALDGYVARRFNQRTSIGAVLDPMADKLLILTTVLGLAWLKVLPLWLAALMLGRDFVIVVGAVSYRLAIGPYYMQPTVLGKVCTFFQFALLVTLLADAAHYVDAAPLRFSLSTLVALFTVLSGAHYVWLWGHKATRHES
ncbi:CDP-alcohol phosphatidyltransferase family protein [Pelomicrobium methylotrophicum]|uniref:CDP-diacylglycerol--glycerol-3-phosphate 3-phosphatidyltransferase n=1 Tax=Pelomicrobium methylotrophicum TaxID=2602750 RepID=A0A5C7EHK2_9PROT|nr:CDP-alcohol phosphatidyltransferase family protein [Pelomicrobium methylotrophicum]TXF11726.1 CDP-alcohol phosphatidyltransferase family protein [Pelomicrobium methylotrophicum]